MPIPQLYPRYSRTGWPVTASQVAEGYAHSRKSGAGNPAAPQV